MFHSLPVILLSFFNIISAELFVAFSELSNHTGDSIGNITFTQDGNDSVIIWGFISHLQPGKYLLAIHDLGDITRYCKLTGDYYNPFEVTSEMEVVPEWYIGYVHANKDYVTRVHISHDVMTLAGPYSIIARSLVVHSVNTSVSIQEDMRHIIDAVACGVIGILSPKVRWSSLGRNPSTSAFNNIVLIVLPSVICAFYSLEYKNI